MGEGEFSTLPGVGESKPVAPSITIPPTPPQPAKPAAPPPATSGSSRGGFPWKIIIALILIALIAGGIAAYLGYIDVPGITPKKEAVGPAKPTPSPTPTPSPQPPSPQPEEEMPPPLPDEV